MRLWTCVLLCALVAHGEEPRVSPGADHFYNLEFDQAAAAFRQDTQAHPDDAGAWNRLAQSVLYRQMFRVGALESEMVSRTNPFLRRPTVTPSAEDQRTFEEAIGKVMSITQARLARQPDDTAALYALGVAHALRANYNFLVRKAWLDSLRDATAARRLHARILELDPNAVDARLLPGIHDYLVGSLPLSYRMFGFLAGLRGDRQGGLRALEQVAQQGRTNRDDARMFLAALYRRERRPQEAIPLLQSVSATYPRNYLLKLELVQVYADAGQKEPALAILQDLETAKKAEVPGVQTPPLEKIHFYRGNLLFWYNDLTEALADLRRATAGAHNLDLNTAIMAALREGQTCDLLGRRQEAQAAYRHAISLAPQSDVAKEAQRYLSSPYIRAK